MPKPTPPILSASFLTNHSQSTSQNEQHVIPSSKSSPSFVLLFASCSAVAATSVWYPARIHRQSPRDKNQFLNFPPLSLDGPQPSHIPVPKVLYCVPFCIRPSVPSLGEHNPRLWLCCEAYIRILYVSVRPLIGTRFEVFGAVNDYIVCWRGGPSGHMTWGGGRRRDFWVLYLHSIILGKAV